MISIAAQTVRALVAAMAVAASPSAGPVGAGVVDDVGEHPGAQLPLDLAFVAADGTPLRLGQLFDGKLPVVLVLSSYDCPTLCGPALGPAVSALAGMPLSLGEEYRAATVSLDPRDTPTDAARKQALAFAQPQLASHASGESWPFLVGSAGAIDALAGALGLARGGGAAADALVPPAALFVLSADGQIVRYLYGREFSALQVRLALIDAAAGRIGSRSDRLLAWLFRYDAASHRYVLDVVGFMRVFGVVILLAAIALLSLLVNLRRRQRSRR